MRQILSADRGDNFAGPAERVTKYTKMEGESEVELFRNDLFPQSKA